MCEGDNELLAGGNDMHAAAFRADAECSFSAQHWKPVLKASRMNEGLGDE
jgi:hypothetical protein